MFGGSFSDGIKEPTSPASNGTNGMPLNNMLFIDSPYKDLSNGELLNYTLF